MAKIPIRKPGYSVEHESWFIPLTQGVMALVDSKDVPVLSQHNWYAKKTDRQWSARRTDRCEKIQRSLLMHRVIMNAPNGTEVDHRNHPPVESKVIDNRRDNLRVCSRSLNAMNQRPRIGNASKFKGVSWHRASAKWIASITSYGTQKHLGLFDSQADAAKAYNVAALMCHGDFCRLNEIPKE